MPMKPMTSLLQACPSPRNLVTSLLEFWCWRCSDERHRLGVFHMAVYRRSHDLFAFCHDVLFDLALNLMVLILFACIRCVCFFLIAATIDVDDRVEESIVVFWCLILQVWLSKCLWSNLTVSANRKSVDRLTVLWLR